MKILHTWFILVMVKHVCRMFVYQHVFKLNTRPDGIIVKSYKNPDSAFAGGLVSPLIPIFFFFLITLKPRVE